MVRRQMTNVTKTRRILIKFHHKLTDLLFYPGQEISQLVDQNRVNDLCQSRKSGQKS